MRSLFNCLILLYLIVLMPAKFSFGQNMQVQVVFQHFTPEQVFIRGMEDYSWSFIPLQYVGANTYVIEKSLQVGLQYEFTISYTIPEYYGNDMRYITTRNGIQYTTLYLNNQVIGSQFLVDNLNPTYPGANIMFSMNEAGMVSPTITGPRLMVNDRIPNEVAFKHDTVFYQTAPQGFTEVNAWVVVLADNNFMDTVVVDLDYIRLYARSGDQEELIATQEFHTYNPEYDGGLYIRYPFFPPGDFHDPMPAVLIEQDIIRFFPSDKRRKVWHSWSYNWVSVNPAHTSYRMECRYRANGRVSIQGGIDYRSPSNLWKEAGQGDWLFETNWEWDTLRFDTFSPSVSVHKLKENENQQIKCIIFNNDLYLFFDSKEDGIFEINLTDHSGRNVANISAYLNIGSNKQIISNIDSLSSGNYVVTIQGLKTLLSGKCYIP